MISRRVLPAAVVMIVMVMQAGLAQSQESVEAGNKEIVDLSSLSAVNAGSKTCTKGSVDKETGYKFEIEFTTRGAAISEVRLSEYDQRVTDIHEPLVLLSPVQQENSTVYPLASGGLRAAYSGSESFGIAVLPLDKLNWQMTEPDDENSAVFETLVKDAGGTDVIKLRKTFRIAPDSYDLWCEVEIENQCERQLKARFDLKGPTGIIREDFRGDMRDVMAGFISPKGKVAAIKKDTNYLRKAKKKSNTEKMQLTAPSASERFLWAAITNKYFAAIVQPVPGAGAGYVTQGPAEYYDVDLQSRKPSGQESISFTLTQTTGDLAPAGADGCSEKYSFRIYLGPKSRDIFIKNADYKQFGYIQTISFKSCCCPSALIAPLAFGIMGLMKWMYVLMGPWGNYGVVIMFLVFVVRLVLHPITKKSQVSMMRMQKLGPKMEEIKKKYANDKAELNKKVMELYKEQGVSPVSSFLPMLLQMPIWIALWTAIYASVELRGAGFLPFWITDLSAPDALIKFKSVTIPLVGWEIDSLNLLPLLMGAVMFAQQKLMPQSSQAQTNPQMAQQQKMMMYMMPLLFPIMLYKGPSGVNLYIMSSISAGVVEQLVIRKHIKEKQAEEEKGLVPVTQKTGGKVKKKKPKPFFKEH